MAKIKALRKFIDVVGDFLRPLDLPEVGARKGYEKVIGQSPLFGTTDLQKVKQDFAGSKDLWKSLVSETESTLGVLPGRDAFKQRMVPLLEAEREAFRKGVRTDTAERVEVTIEDKLRDAGLILPGASRGRPVTARLTKKTNPSGEIVKKPKLDIDAQVQRLVQEGNIEEAADLLYDQVENIARLTPQSMVDLARARGGSIFYPVRSARNKTWSEMIGIPQRAIGRGTSIGSANAGPFVEEFRTLSLLPFMKVDSKTGLIAFDKTAAIEALGEKAFKGTGKAPSLLEQQAKAMVDVLNDPDYLNQAATGLSDKTWVYDVMEADPSNPLALVADNIGATARTGVSYATLPESTVQSMYGQIPERVVAQVLGLQPSALQEIDWLVSRVLRAEPSSAVPFGRVIRQSEMEKVAQGLLMNPPHSMNPSDEAIQAVSAAVNKQVQKRSGGLVDQDVQDVARGRLANWKPSAGDELYLPDGRPNPESVAAIIQPDARSIGLPKGMNMVQRAQRVIDEIRKFGPGASMSVIAALVAREGFSSLSEVMRTAGYSGNGEMDALAQMQNNRSNPMESIARRQAATNVYGGAA